MNTQFMQQGTRGATFGSGHAGGAADVLGPGSYSGPGIRYPAILGRLIDVVAPCPWQASAGSRFSVRSLGRGVPKPSLYSPDERIRRDRSPWTLVQGVLAPIQFVVFAVSLFLVLRYFLTGKDYEIATVSIVTKTALLYTIMITGAIWEKDIFGQWLFAKAFFWEDVFSILVLVLQTAYLVALLVGWGSPREQMMIAIAAYAAYIINATQFLLKLRAARLQARDHSAVPAGAVGGSL
jgi:3-vinyl bacteriochlorophyllide hydratase